MKRRSWFGEPDALRPGAVARNSSGSSVLLVDGYDVKSVALAAFVVTLGAATIIQWARRRAAKAGAAQENRGANA